MRIMMKSLLAGLAMLAMSGVASADLSTVASAPTTNLLVDRGDGAGSGGGSSQATFGYRNADGAGEEGTRGRGQSFAIDAGLGTLYDISSLTVALAGGAGNGTRGEGDLQFQIFEYTGSGATANDQIDDVTSWNTGTGASSGTVVFSDSYAVAANSTFNASDFLEIAFDPGELQLAEDKAYGFFFQYVLDDVTGLNSDFTIAFDADLGTAGVAPFGYLLNTSNAVGAGNGQNGGSDTRDLNYFITGTAAPVPEPTSLALLGLAGLGMIARRRRS